jgi:tetratricopeptide (TPR) repeat protein
LIFEIHRRSLWQVLAIYLGACWAVLEASDQVIERYLLPEWVYPTEIIILLVTLPIVLATAFVRESAPSDAAVSVSGELRDPTLLGDTEAPEEPEESRPARGFFTWRRTTLWMLFAFGALALISASVVIRGAGRVTEAHGEAGEAFEERAWLVVAEFGADEGEAEVAEAARAALIVDLQQSQYVNVYTASQIAPVLRRMTLSPRTPIDEALALEIAEREGLSAVLAAQVNKLGEDYVFIARVIQAGTRDELVSIRSAARSERLLDGVEKLSREVRRRLGEEKSATRRSRALPRVTTRSLEALKKYAQAADSYSRERDYERALELALQAVRHDSMFAEAYRLAAEACNRMRDWTAAAEYSSLAYALRDHLTDRERLRVEARYYWSVEVDMRRAAETYDLLLSQYPDDGIAADNLAGIAGIWLGESEMAYRASLRAVELRPYSTLSLAHAVSNARRVGHWDVADSLITLARNRGFHDEAARWSWGQAVGLGDWERADALCDSLLESPGRSLEYAHRQEMCGNLDIASGRIRRGVDRVSAAAGYYARVGIPLDYSMAEASCALGESIAGRPADARSHIEAIIDNIPPDSLGDLERLGMRSTLQTLLAMAGLPDLAERVAVVYAPYPDTAGSNSRYGKGMSQAAQALSRGDASAALDRIRRVRPLDFHPRSWDWWLDLMSGLAFAELGQPDSAVVYLEAAVDPERVTNDGHSRIYLPLILRRLAELEASRGNRDTAIRYYRRFIELWSEADPELQGQVGTAGDALARLTGTELH